MRKLTACITSTIFILVAHAQNIGVNTTNPQASLDVRGTQRVGGLSSYMFYDSATGRIQWAGAALYVPVSQQVIRHSASSEGLYAGSGKLEYRNTTGPVFFTDWTTGNGYFKNNLGINNLNPQFPLTLNSSLGDKISLWTDGTPTHYGFGIQPSLLQIFSKTNLDDIAFGYGSSTSFTEAMRIKGNGNVGIGTNSPNSPLSFPPMLGRKISLYPGATGNVGMSVLGNLFQIYSDNPSADIAFGYDQAGTLIERMRIKGNGNVGIGNSNPQYSLEVNGLMRLWGTNPNNPGIWLNDAGVDRGFLGLQYNDHIGFYGTGGIGWGFMMNTNNGALAINGNEGSAGQLLQSSGSTAAPQWAAMASVLPTYSIGNYVLGGAYVDVNGPGEFAMYNASITLSVSGNARLIISATYDQYTFCPLIGPCKGIARCYFKVDGASTEGQSVMVQSVGGYASGTLANFFYDVGPGSHTITFYTRQDNGGNEYWMYLQSATVLVLKQ